MALTTATPGELPPHERREPAMEYFSLHPFRLPAAYRARVSDSAHPTLCILEDHEHNTDNDAEHQQSHTSKKSSRGNERLESGDVVLKPRREPGYCDGDRLGRQLQPPAQPRGRVSSAALTIKTRSRTAIREVQALAPVRL